MKKLSEFDIKTIFFLCVSLALVCSIDGVLVAQEGNISPKELPPGVTNTIEPYINFAETHQWSDIPSLVGQDGANDWARDIFFNKEIWCLEFSFKPMRMSRVDVLGENGRLEAKNVWYLVYSVTNTGKRLGLEVEYPADNQLNVMVRDSEQKYVVKSFKDRRNNLDGTYKPKPVDYSNATPDENGEIPGTVRFVPQFVLVSGNVDDPIVYEKQLSGFFTGQKKSELEKMDKIYFDEFLPLAFRKIASFESKNVDFDFKNSVEIPTVKILPGHTVWGIATWTDVDPKIDRFAVYISGLTNSLRWDDASALDDSDDLDPVADENLNDPLRGREIQRRVLKLNFYRPGDEFDENGEEFFYGAPGELDFKWIYL